MTGLVQMRSINKSTDISSHVPKQIVAAIITHKGRLALFKRSQRVQGDQGLWHCITGFLDEACFPINHITVEIEEEAGISANNLHLIKNCQLMLTDGSGQPWCVHAYHFESASKNLVTNWEHDDATWCLVNELDGYNVVSWFSSVFTNLKVKSYLEPRSTESFGPLTMNLQAI